MFLYLLFKQNIIVYVGQTTNPLKIRFAGHDYYGLADLVMYTYASSKSELDEMEQFFISKYKPKYNSIYINALYTGTDYSDITFTKYVKGSKMDDKNKVIVQRIVDSLLEINKDDDLITFDTYHHQSIPYMPADDAINLILQLLFDDFFQAGIDLRQLSVALKKEINNLINSDEIIKNIDKNYYYLSMVNYLNLLSTNYREIMRNPANLFLKTLTDQCNVDDLDFIPTHSIDIYFYHTLINLDFNAKVMVMDKIIEVLKTPPPE